MRIERIGQIVAGACFILASLGFLFGKGPTLVHWDIWVVITGVSLILMLVMEVMARNYERK